MTRARTTFWLAAGGMLAAGLPAAAAPARPAHFEQEGLRVEIEAAPLDARPGGDDAIRTAANVRLRFRVREAGKKGKPVSGLAPLAWLISRKTDEPAPGREQCEYDIRSLLAGRLARSAEVNLNEYWLVTLDDNNSVSIIDPQIESSKTKTLGLVSLTSKGQDFVLSPDRRTAFVTLPTQRRIAAADLFGRKARYVEVGGTPRRITLQPDGRLAWVGDAAGEAVTAVDVTTVGVAGTTVVGPGPHEFTFRDDSRYVFVASRASATLAVVDAQTFGVKQQVDVGTGAVGVAYSSHSGQAYVALAEGKIAAVDGARFTLGATIPTERTLTGFWVAPGGRFGFALHGKDDRLSITDLATNRVVHEIATGPAPDHVAFTESFAYVRHAESADIRLVDLGSLARPGPPLVSTVPMGQLPPAVAAERIAPTIATLPEGGGVLVLNPADRAIYHFMEGMNAPMGSYRTYPWTAHGVLISDRTIREVEKGLYQTEFQAPAAGTYTVPFLVPTSPKLWGCFSLEVEALPGIPRTADALRMESLFAGHVFTPGTPQEVRVRLTDPATGEPLSALDDVMLLFLRGPTWQWRGAARDAGDGQYEVTVTFPEAGQYMVMVSSPSRGVAFGEEPSAVARVGTDSGAAAAPETGAAAAVESVTP